MVLHFRSPGTIPILTWVPARRFPIVQGEKVRPIDDFSQYLINSAFGTQEKVLMLGLDQVVSWTRAWAGSEGTAREISLKDSGGKVYRTWVHPEWGTGGFSDLVGRVADLKSAYKQLAIHPAHASLSIIAVQKPSGERVDFFKAKSLMFGQTAAVYSFLRFSRAISALAGSLLSLVTVEFFDDFTQVEPAATSESAQFSMESLLRLLGWKIADTEAKRKPFSKEFVSLGVQVNLSKLATGEIVLQQKPGRAEALKSQVDALLHDNNFGFKDALSVRGRIFFCEGQTFGRVAAPVIRMLTRWSNKLQ